MPWQHSQVVFRGRTREVHIAKTFQYAVTAGTVSNAFCPTPSPACLGLAGEPQHEHSGAEAAVFHVPYPADPNPLGSRSVTCQKHQGGQRSSCTPSRALQRQTKPSILNPSAQPFASVVVQSVKMPTHFPLNWSQVTFFSPNTPPVMQLDVFTGSV